MVVAEAVAELVEDERAARGAVPTVGGGEEGGEDEMDREQLLCRRVRPLEVWDKRSAGAAAVAGRDPPLPRLLGRRRADRLDSQIRARAAGGEVELVQAVADLGKKRANTALDPVLDDRKVPASLVAGGCRGCERFLASTSIGDDVRLGSLVLKPESLEPRAERVGQRVECARQPFVTDARDLIVTRGGGVGAGVRSFRYCDPDAAAGRGAVAGVAVDPAGGERLVECVVGCSAVGIGVGASFAARIIRERGLGARGVGFPRASPVAVRRRRRSIAARSSLLHRLSSSSALVSSPSSWARRASKPPQWRWARFDRSCASACALALRFSSAAARWS